MTNDQAAMTNGCGVDAGGLLSLVFEPPRTPRAPRKEISDFLLGALGVLGGLFQNVQTPMNSLAGDNMQHDLEANKLNAIAFYRMAYLGEPAKAVELYVGAEYIQHNPLVDNGPQPFIDYFTRMAEEYPGKSIEFVRAVAEGDLVALHTHQTWPGDEEYVTMDFFRFDNQGKIVEHWDAIQEVPGESKNGNTMY